jgi:crotonobetainyl-CoA:carnitine CoA-transferase CaiB-like acyl-CoA transferase
VRDDTEWKALCTVLGRPELADDPAYATVAARRENHDAIDALIGQWTAARSKMEVMQCLQQAGVPAGAVLDGRDLNLDPQLNRRGLLEWVRFEPEREMGDRRLIIGRPWRFGKEEVAVRAPAPKFGEHNREVLREILKYDEARIDELERAEVIANRPKKMREMLTLTVEEQVKMGRLAYRDAEYRKHLGMT